jgi:hypothetical protein
VSTAQLFVNKETIAAVKDLRLYTLLVGPMTLGEDCFLSLSLIFGGTLTLTRYWFVAGAYLAILFALQRTNASYVVALREGIGHDCTALCLLLEMLQYLS